MNVQPLDGASASVARKSRSTHRPPLSKAHADVALCDITDVCALLRMSGSWIYAEVSAGRFPAPAIRQPRCSRWRIADVRAYLIERTAGGAFNIQAGAPVTARAIGASAAAKAKRLRVAEISGA